MRQDPLISVIMPCYNRAKFLRRSITSVLEQTHTHLELIFVNDGSTDSSLEIINQFSDSRIVVIDQQHLGVSQARNNALAKAKGEFIAFLDTDDTWLSECLCKLYRAFNNRPNTVICYCGWQNIGLSGGRGDPFIPPDHEKSNKLEILFEKCRWPIHTTLTRQFAIKETGGFEKSLQTSEDFLLWLTIGIKHPIRLVPEVLAFYHFHEDKQACDDVEKTAINHWLAQQLFLKDNPELKNKLGSKCIAKLMHGTLLQQGYDCYWNRDLKTARTIFKTIMKTGYGSLKDWKHMLPAILPFSLHSALVKKLGS